MLGNDKRLEFAADHRNKDLIKVDLSKWAGPDPYRLNYTDWIGLDSLIKVDQKISARFDPIYAVG